MRSCLFKDLFHGNQTFWRADKLSHITIRGGHEVERSLISCCCRICYVPHLLSLLVGAGGGDRRRAVWLPLRSRLSPRVRFTRSGWRIPAKPTQRSPHCKCWSRGVCANTSKRIKHFVSWFPRRYVLLCGPGPLITESNKPRLPMDNLARFGWERTATGSAARAKSFIVRGRCPWKMSTAKTALQVKMKDLFKWTQERKDRWFRAVVSRRLWFMEIDVLGSVLYEWAPQTVWPQMKKQPDRQTERQTDQRNVSYRQI